MKYTEKEYESIWEYLLFCIKAKDPVNYEKLNAQLHDLGGDSPQHKLLATIEAYSELLRYETPSTQARVLELLNANIEGEIKGIQVVLSRDEQGLYKRDVLDIKPESNISYFLQDLRVLQKELKSGLDRGNDYQTFEK